MNMFAALVQRKNIGSAEKGAQIMKLSESMRIKQRRNMQLDARIILPSLFAFILLSVFLASGWFAGETSRANTAGGISYTIEQGTFSSPVQLLQGSESVIDFYGWDSGTSNTSLDALTGDSKSVLFLYQDDAGEISLVAIHGKATTGNGGMADFLLAGVPAGAAWVVMDDTPTSDTYSVTPPTGSAEWHWSPGNTDGGALEAGFNGAFKLTIDADFISGIDDWDFLSGPTTGSPTEIAIPSLTEPLTIRATELATPTPCPMACVFELTYSIEQGAMSSTVQLLEGSESVIDFYGWDNVGFPSSTKQTTLTADDTSVIFLYKDNTGEISVVAIHGKMTTGSGGNTEFQLFGVPAGAAWVVEDDTVDIYSVTPPTGSAVWVWNATFTDGGALEGGFNGAFALTIDPDFITNITDWDFLSGPSAVNPTRFEIEFLDEPLTIRATKVVVPTPTKQPDPGDTDVDGCSDQAENGLDPQFGGLRNYKYFWDFYDVWTHPSGQPTLWERNAVLNLFDIFAVALRFGSGPTLSKQDALAEALSQPSDDTSYHAGYDRGPLVGPNPWERGPPDGSINIVDDILGVAAQFGHDCS